MIRLTLLVFFLCIASAQALEPQHRYYFNPVYRTQEFKKFWPSTFASLPKYNSTTALEKAKRNKEVKRLLNSDPNYFVTLFATSYTENDGRTWTDWEVGIARDVMNQTIRFDAIFGVDPMTGNVNKLDRPTMHMPISSHDSN